MEGCSRVVAMTVHQQETKGRQQVKSSISFLRLQKERLSPLLHHQRDGTHFGFQLIEKNG